MKKLYFIIFISICSNSIAQDSLYSKVFDHLSNSITPYDAAKTIDSGIVIVGDYNGNAGFILRVDSLSNELWHKTVSSVNSIYYSGVVATSDTGFVAIGMQNNQAFCVKYNDAGDTLWSRTLGTIGQNNAVQACITTTYDSMFVCSWASWSEDRCYIAKIDLNGGLIWSSAFEGAGSSVPNVIKEAPDSNLYIGTTLSWSTSALFKVNPIGDLVWVKSFDSGNIHDFSFLGDSIFISSADPNYSSTSIIKTDTSANIAWSKVYPGFMDFNPPMRSRMFLAKDSTLVFLVSSQMASANTANRIDQDGNLIFTSGVEMGGVDVLPAANNGAIFIGLGPVYGIKSWNPHIGIVRTSPALLGGDCTSVGWSNTSMDITVNTADLPYNFVGSVVLSQQPLDEGVMIIDTHIGCVDFLGELGENSALNFTVFPNASNGKFMFSSESNGEYKLSIYNSIGTLIYNSMTTGMEFSIDLSNEPQGLYLYRIYEKESNRNANGKLLLKK